MFWKLVYLKTFYGPCCNDETFIYYLLYYLFDCRETKLGGISNSNSNYTDF